MTITAVDLAKDGFPGSVSVRDMRWFVLPREAAEFFLYLVSIDTAPYAIDPATIALAITTSRTMNSEWFIEDPSAELVDEVLWDAGMLIDAINELLPEAFVFGTHEDCPDEIGAYWLF